ncbi:MAG: Ig-like domain-containing protein [Syntrophales bacterium]|jgi:N-acetylneuraminic acid mutarotase|nr:Ig-like domain-containing protein [Syntrophales bacterium]
MASEPCPYDAMGLFVLYEDILETLELYVNLIKEIAMKNARKMINTIFAMLLGLIVITVSNQAFAQSGTWETKAPMPTVRWNAASGVINSKLYVAGGTGTGANSLATLEVYDPATNAWATKASMPTARNSVGGGVINGKLYVVGGNIAQNQKLATLEVYDPANDTWTTKASMHTPRSGPGAVAIDGKLYVAGGCLGFCAPVTNALEVYDPATDTWTTRSPLPTARGGTDVEAVNGLFYVMGGCCGAVSSQSDLMAKTIETYNPITDTWTTETQHLVGVGDTAGTINGKIYAAKSAATEVYDPATDTWAFLSPMAITRQYAAGGVINGKLYVAGGYDGAAGSATLEAFTPLTGMTSCIGDVNGDGKIGFAEAISALQVLSGLRLSVCNQAPPLDGVCGSSNGGVFTTAPSAGLCGAGSATSVTGTGPWSWSCAGSNGGATASCATLQASPVDGVCGSSNGGVFTTAPSAYLCSAGSATSVTGDGPWSWSCTGANGGATAICAATLEVPPVDGVCGSASGGIFTTAPSSDLCGAGSATSVTGNGSWSWSCTGANGGTTAACAATLEAPPVDGVCGSANGGIFTTAPSAYLCSAGSATSVTGNGSWSWSCTGANGGTTAACAATLTVPPATLVSIAVTPTMASIPMGGTQAFIATGTYSDGTSHDISNIATWTSGTIGVATVVSPGITTGLSVGMAMITATSGYASGSATLFVSSATLVSIAVTPTMASIPMGLTQSFVATGTYSDGTTHDISNIATWTSGAIAVATVVSPGVATGVSTGTATITATSGGKSGSATLTVTAAPSSWTEVWVGSDGQGNTSTTTLTKNSSGTITTTGQWTYNYGGYPVTCLISSGNMAVTGTNVTLTMTGTATNTNPYIPSGFNTSFFTLSLTGTMSAGQGSGTSTISFQNPDWPPPIYGNWTAQRQSGSGVTN